MDMSRRLVALCLVLMLGLGPLVQAQDMRPDMGAGVPSRTGTRTITPGPLPDARELLSNIDGYFTENLGQLDPSIRYYCMGTPLSVAFGDSWVGYDYRPEGGDRGVMFRVTFEGANAIKPEGLEPTTWKNNYFIGNVSEKWVIGAGPCKMVNYRSLYDGIDLAFTFNDHKLKYELQLSPGIDPSLVRFRFDGVQRLEIERGSGNLAIWTELGRIDDLSPIAYQPSSVGAERIDCDYELLDPITLGFRVCGYRSDEPLIIDPELDLSTVIGGSTHMEFIYGVEVDDSGNIFVAGETWSSDFPTTPGCHDSVHDGVVDGIVYGVAQNGSALLFSTYIGGSDSDHMYGIDFDPSGNLMICGDTRSTDFPITPGAFLDEYPGHTTIVIVKMSCDGRRLLNSTFVGEKSISVDIAVDADGNSYVVGWTQSSSFPVTSNAFDKTLSGSQDLIVLKMDPNCTALVYSTYVGGSLSESIGSNYALYGDIFLDESNRVYCCGRTTSTDFPTTSDAYCDHLTGACNSVIFILNAQGTALDHSTYFGGTNTDRAISVTVDADGGVVICGDTNSTDLPVTAGAYQTTNGGDRDSYCAKFDTNLSSLTFCTYLGGQYNEECAFAVLGEDGTVIICGQTDSTDFPMTPDAWYPNKKDYADVYLAILDPTASDLLFSTFMGSPTLDTPSQMDIDGTSLVVIGTAWKGFPVTEGAYEANPSGTVNTFIARILIDDLINITVTQPSVPINMTAEAGNRFIRLSWEPPIDTGGVRLKGYDVYRGTEEDALVKFASTTPLTTTLVDHPPLLGQLYYYAVKAFNRNYTSDLSAVVNATTYGTPYAPTALTASPGCRSVSVNWTPPIDTGALPILGFRLYRGPSSSSLEPLPDLGNVIRYQDEGLENGKEYFYRVLAFNAMGDGENSTVVSATPRSPPSSPEYFTLTPGDGKVSLRWRVPLLDGGAPVDGYNILRGPTGTDLSPLATVGQFDNAYVDDGLTNGQTYFYAVQAFNIIGPGPLTEVLNATPLGVPGAPRDLALTGSDGQVTLTWDAPEEDGGTPILGYNIYRGATETSMLLLYRFLGTSYTDTGLVNGEPLLYRISAYNRVGEGPSTEARSATPLALPDAPADLLAEASNDLISLSWLAPASTGGAPLLEFRVHRGTSPDTLELLRTLAPSTLTLRDVDIVVGTTYFYAVSAVTMAGEGPRSPVASTTPYGLPSAPLGLNITAGDHEVTLTWSAPASDGAAAIEGYVVLRGTSPTDLKELETLTGVLMYKDRTVTNGVTYHYAIVAVNKAGRGPATEAVSATPFKPATVPGKVRTLLAEAKGAEVTLAWTAPESDGGSPVTGFVVQRGSSRDALAVVATLGAVTAWTDTAVERGTTYYYTVAAVNAVGQGEAFAAYEVKVSKEKEKDEGPGFGAFAVGMAIAVTVLVMGSQRRRCLDR